MFLLHPQKAEVLMYMIQERKKGIFQRKYIYMYTMFMDIKILESKVYVCFTFDLLVVIGVILVWNKNEKLQSPTVEWMVKHTQNYEYSSSACFMVMPRYC